MLLTQNVYLFSQINQSLYACILVFMFTTYDLPDVFDGYFKPRNEIHNLQTRNAHKLNVISVKNNYCKSTLKYKSAKIYYELSNDIMYCKSLNIFKNRTKNYKSFY